VPVLVLDNALSGQSDVVSPRETDIDRAVAVLIYIEFDLVHDAMSPLFSTSSLRESTPGDSVRGLTK
jgi:hypothetical protein